MLGDFRESAKEDFAALQENLEKVVDGMEGIIDGVQGKRADIELFKKYPELREEAEKALENAKAAYEEVQVLAHPARVQAQTLYDTDPALDASIFRLNADEEQSAHVQSEDEVNGAAAHPAKRLKLTTGSQK
jgi:hypothetical protein